MHFFLRVHKVVELYEIITAKNKNKTMITKSTYKYKYIPRHKFIKSKMHMKKIMYVMKTIRVFDVGITSDVDIPTYIIYNTKSRVFMR